MTYQLGFLVGNAEDNFDGLYLATYLIDPEVVKLKNSHITEPRSESSGVFVSYGFNKLII